MAAGLDIIGEFMERLNSSDNNQENYALWRELLHRVVTTALSDPASFGEKSKQGQSSSSSSSSSLRVALDFLHHIIQVCPRAFHVQNVTRELVKDGGGETEDCYALDKLLIGHLLGIVAHFGCNEFNKRITKEVSYLLQRICSKDPYTFRRLCELLVGTLNDLIVISERFYGEHDGTYQPSVGRFSTPGSDKSPVVLLNEDACETLQTEITCLLQPVAASICQFSRDCVFVDQEDVAVPGVVVPCLWSVLGCQLQCGEVMLKTVSLELACALLEHGGLPSGQPLDYFLSMLLELIDLLASGFDDCEGDYVRLEQSVYQCLSCVVDGAAKPFQKEPSIMYSTILNSLADTVTTHGLMTLRTDTMREGITDILAKLYREIPRCTLSGQVMRHKRREVVWQLTQEIGQKTDSKYVISVLRQCVCLEVPATTLSSSIVGEQQQPDTSRKRKLSVHNVTSPKPTTESYSDQSPYGSDSNVPSTAELLTDKLEQLAEHQQDAAGLEGMRVLLEVLTWCQAFCSSAPPSHIAAAGVPTTLSSCSSSSSKSQHVLTQYLSTDLLQSLVSAWTKMLGTKEPQHYMGIVRSIGALLAVQDLCSFSMDLLQGFTCLLSLHWLPNEVSWLDLKISDQKATSKLSQELADKVDGSCIAECVRVLALMPKEVAGKWRGRVLQMALGDSTEEVRAAAIYSFPIFLHHAGPNANHLVFDHLHGCLADKSPCVEVALADTMGSLACVISRKAVLCRSPFPKNIISSHHAINVKCSSCDPDLEITPDLGNNGGGNQKDRPKPVTPNMFLPFTSLLQSKDTATRLKAVCSVRQVFSHLSVRANNAITVKMLQACLELLKDPDCTVRRTFSTVLPYVAGYHGNDAVTDTEKQVIKALASASKDAKKSVNNPRLLETVLLSIGELAKACEGDLLLLMLMPLVDGTCSPSCPLEAAMCHNQLRQIARHKKYRPRLLFVKFAKDLCQRIVDQLHECQRKRIREPLTIISEIVDAFEYEDVKGFLRRFENFLLPPLVKKASSAASFLLQTLAKQLGDPNHKGPLARNIQHIYCHLVLSCEEDQLIKTFDFLKKESSWDLKELLKVGLNIDHELILHLHTHYDKVLKGLKFLCLHLGTLGGKTDFDDITEEDIVQILEGKLLGILVHFDNHLNNESIPIKTKREVFASLMALMRLMGPVRITAVRLRLMTTLKIGLRFKEREFIELCCKTWNCFVRSVDPAALGPMLSQIIVNLLPLLHHLPAQVADIFNFLIVENRTQLQSHFHELYFMPEMPELADINAVLNNYMERTYSKEVKTQLRHLLKGTSHESADVRQLALTKLRLLLHQHQATLHQYILGSETVDPTISQIASALLSGCRESDETIRALFGQCLGQLGAIDPGRLDVHNRPTQERVPFHDTVNYDNFAFDLINVLSKAFLRAEDRTAQDCVAFAIQELIIKYQVSSLPTRSRGTTLWGRFSEEVKEILTPLMHSKYMLTTKLDWSQTKKPIYGSKKCRSFSYWVSTLTGYLASKVEEERAAQVFGVCMAVIKNHHQVALYLLPYVTTHMLLEGNQQHRNELCKEILTVLNDVKKADARLGSTADLRHMSAQTIFSLLDHCTQWKRHRITKLAAAAAAASKGRAVSADVYKQDRGYNHISGFLDEIPQDLLAVASYKCGAITRALMHYELHIDSSNLDLTQDDIDFFQKLYVALDEPDGVAGIVAIKQDMHATLQEQILEYESTGQMSDASVCYDLAARQQPDNLGHRQGLLRCRLALGELTSAMDLANSMVTQRPEWSGSLNAYRVEAAWKLGQWDKLNVYLKPEEHSRNWNVGLGKILLALKDRNETEYSKHLTCVRNDLMGPLSAASMEVGSYQRGYQYVVRLHMLNEVEEGARTLLNFPPNSVNVAASEAKQLSVGTFLEYWENRLNFTQASFRTQEPILNLRRILLSLAANMSSPTDPVMRAEIGQCWLHMAQISRESGLVQTAHSFLLLAEEYGLPDFCLEHAHWLWDRGTTEKAQTYLEKALEAEYPDRAAIMDAGEKANITPARRMACAKVLLLLGKYYEDTASQESNAIMRQYRDVLRMHTKWEDGYFYLAKYYDKMMSTLGQIHKKGEFAHHVINNFGQSLMFGSKYIYQSMPRLLALWLDYGQAALDPDATDVVRQGMRSFLVQINKLMETFTNKLAPYQFLTAFPQLVSRICHPHSDVFRQLVEIIARLLVVFPQQAVWMMMAVSKSSYQVRVKRCLEIFNKAKSLNSELHKFLQDATKLTDRLLDLCNRNVEGNNVTLSISQHFKPLQRLIDDSNFSPIQLPLQNLMTVTLPSGSVDPARHDPFPGQQIYLKGLEDMVEVLVSLQKPKKITMRGSDGKLYTMLCKPKDDLRKDARLMEFNGIVNKCLRKHPESRRRDLHIRTYTVTPLNEECGLLEWVPNTTGLRHILLKLLRERGYHTSGKELKQMLVPPNAKLEKKLEIYRTKLVPRHPAVFGDWFLRTFTDPTSWYNARVSYCRTTAVMSMVGYILGLGDRHGENVLFDSTNGDCVHVDFNCLFNKGETFDYPEVVPFRLTHNMVQAMGPMGYEGVFRRACEVTLRVMRDQSDPLMSVLKTFIYDPLVEWSKPARGRSNPTESGQIKNEMAQTHVNNIEARLRGVLRNKSKSRGLPLSVEGQTKHLIKEATDANNLCQMYIGWAPYM